jgi:hypothetical protein
MARATDTRRLAREGGRARAAEARRCTPLRPALIPATPISIAAIAAIAATAATAAGCRDLSSFTTSGDHFEGPVIQADFVRTGVDATTSLCLTLDANHLQDAPGAISTSDGRFVTVALRPIPQIWHDPLSTLSFGEGRLKNLIYVATATTPFDDGNSGDVFTVLSLMQSGDVEVRLIRGAPGLGGDGGSAPGSGTSVFAIFDLSRKPGACSF